MTNRVAGNMIEDGTVSFSDVAAGFAVQVAYSQSGAAATGATVLPLDDTIPQNTEGDEYLTVSITPKATSHVLRIDVLLVLANSAAGYGMTAALFQDSTANALAATAATCGATNELVTLRLTHHMVAGTTSATTFRVRAGASVAGTTTLNGSAGARLLGGVSASSISVTEIKA